MIRIRIPNICLSEQNYVFDILLNEFLGLSFEIVPCNDQLISISQDDSDITLTFNTDFFINIHKNWLKKETLPVLPLKYWHAQDDIDLQIINLQPIPVLYGEAGLIKKEKHWHFNMDIFGSIFFMLSRYEELINTDRDQHDRFPSTGSVAFKAGFTDRPLVNEYLEILWSCMKQLWPSLQRKNRVYRKLISCDVDHPYDTAGHSLKKTTLRVGARLVRDKNLYLACLDNLNYLFKKFSSDRFDQYYNNIYWIMEVNKRAENQVDFYFIPLQTSLLYEDDNDVISPKITNLVKKILKEGHKIGIHPGYETYKSNIKFKDSVERLRLCLNNIGVELLGGRQHYLRYDMGTTPQLWQENNLDYDSSLGYADRPGFRCGVCYEYSMFDLKSRKKMRLKQRPLIIMESTIISKQYEGLGYSTESLDRFRYFENICKQYDGDFTLLWHNSSFSDNKSKGFYCSVLGP